MTKPNKGQWLAIALSTPALIIFVVFAVFPMIAAAYLSLLKWNSIGAPKFIGLANWVTLFHDGQTLHSLWLTIEVMVLSWLIQTPISMAIGIYLAGRQRFRSIVSIAYFLPLLFSSVAIALLWSYILNPNFGLVNTLLQKMNLSSLALDWLGNTSIVLWTLVAIVSWQYIPFHTLIYQAGRKQIAESLYEAAQLDGSTPWSSFRYVTLPQLKYTIVTSTILILTGSLTYFDLIYILTNGGPANATNVLAIDMYHTAFVQESMGYGSVMAVVIAFIGIVLSIVMIRFTGFGKMESQAEGL